MHSLGGAGSAIEIVSDQSRSAEADAIVRVLGSVVTELSGIDAANALLAEDDRNDVCYVSDEPAGCMDVLEEGGNFGRRAFGRSVQSGLLVDWVGIGVECIDRLDT